MDIYINSLINLERCVRNSDTLAKFVNCIFLQLFLLLLVYIFIARVWENTQVKLYI